MAHRLEMFKKHSSPQDTKECSNYRTIALIAHASKMVLKEQKRKRNKKCLRFKMDSKKEEILVAHKGISEEGQSMLYRLQQRKPLFVWVMRNSF